MNNTLVLEIQKRLANFTLMKKKQLKLLAEDMRLAMGYEGLKACQTHWRDTEKRQPAMHELYFIDRIVSRRSQFISHATLENTDIEDEYIDFTFRDMCNKNVALNGKKAPPIKLEDSFRIASSYLAKQNIFSLCGAGCGDAREENMALSVTDAEGNTVCYREAKALTVDGERYAAGVCFILLLPSREECYKDSVAAFFNDDKIKDTRHAVLSVSELGLAITLASCTVGTVVRLDTLSSADMISCLCQDHVGRSIIRVAANDVEEVCSIARSYGLEGIFFATNTGTNRFVAVYKDNTVLNIDLGFIRRQASVPASAYFLIKQEDFSAARNAKPLYANGAEVTGALWCDGLLMSPASSVLDNNCFAQSLNTVIDSLLGIIAAGVPRRSVSLSLAYRLPSDIASSTENGRSLATILGAYRAMMELGIADMAPKVIYSPLPREFTSVAFTRTPMPPKSTELSKMGAPLYFIGFSRNADCSPSLSSLKQMWDYTAELFASGAVLSCVPVTGSLSRAIEVLSTKDMGITLNDQGNELLSVSLQGVLIEGARDIGIPNIGSVIER